MIIEDNFLPYKVGGLLYTPATDRNIVHHLKENMIKDITSLALCLEDSITDDILVEAEINLKKIMADLRNTKNLPLLFVRVRTPEHLQHIYEMLGDAAELLTGFVLPKFSLDNADKYLEITDRINSSLNRTMYIMPTIESPMFTAYNGAEKLEMLKQMIDYARKYVLNIRFGGNDFLNLYGLRRNIQQNIYQIGVVRDVLVNILNVFSGDYVVSGAVWEYYDNGTDDKWKIGLEKELELDRLNGFIGKTAIHPSQLPVIYESLKPCRQDYEDAKHILSWTEKLGVSRNISGNRMNEVKTHQKWAEKMLILGEIYGINEVSQ
ncbi:MAG: HpcH/HpaI aldolase/citrate lyase family protein [Ruminococcus sp.]|nr:HpcH/HpaI aldolase/citrate lyase family protein [Ruminococcus sp.]